MEYSEDLSVPGGLNFESDLPAEALAQTGIGRKRTFFKGLEEKAGQLCLILFITF